MKIRPKQIDQVTLARRQESQRLLLNELRQTAPAATAHSDDAQLLTVIEQATAKARTYGVTSNEATTTFVKLAVFAGSCFDEEPGVKRFLQSPDLSPDYKVTLLAELVVGNLKKSC